MILNYTAIQTLIILGLLIAALGFIVWHLPLLSITTKSRITPKRLINKLTQLALYFIWLIGLSLAVMAFGFIADWYTFDTFLWVPFEMVLIISLGMLCITSMVIAYHGKGHNESIRHYFRILVKHLNAQMKLILIVTLVFIINFLTLGK